jgi:hypothetical protein
MPLELTPKNLSDGESQTHDAHANAANQTNQDQLFVFADQFQQTIVHGWYSWINWVARWALHMTFHSLNEFPRCSTLVFGCCGLILYPMTAKMRSLQAGLFHVRTANSMSFGIFSLPKPPFITRFIPELAIAGRTQPSTTSVLCVQFPAEPGREFELSGGAREDLSGKMRPRIKSPENQDIW